MIIEIERNEKKRKKLQVCILFFFLFSLQYGQSEKKKARGFVYF
jgi:hypothetical protein